MAQQGWISIRKVPVVHPKEGLPEAHIYYNRLQKFFARNTICPECLGDGFTRDLPRPVHDTIIKFKGIGELEIIYQRGNLPMAEVIREILSIELEGRKVCPKCKGRRFIPRHGKSKDLT